MTELQFTIADEILQHLYNNAGHSTVYKVENKHNDVDISEMYFIRAILEDEYFFIKELQEDDDPSEFNPTVFRLTAKGYNAAKVGFKTYVDQIAEKEKMEMNKLKYATRNAKNARVLAIISIIISIVLPFILYYVKENKSVNYNGKDDSQHRQNISDKGLPVHSSDVVFDTIFVDRDTIAIISKY